MERLTKRLADEQSVMDCKTCELEEKRCTAFTCRQRLKVRLAAIEDILGAEYDLDHLRELVQAEKDGRVVVLDDKLLLSILAGARAIENNRKLFGATYCWDICGKCGGPKKISYYKAAKLLREMVEPILTREEAEAALKGGTE